MNSLGNGITRDLNVTSRNRPYQEENRHRMISSLVICTGSMAIASSVGVSEVMLAGMLTEAEMFMQTNRSQKIVGTLMHLIAGYEIFNFE